MLADFTSRITLLDVILFGSHVLLWTIWTILIRVSQFMNSSTVSDESPRSDYAYEIVGVVLLTEVTKLLLSLFNYLFVSGHEFPSAYDALVDAVSRWKMGIYFAVPAFVYAVYNSLFFLNLGYFDPVTYRVLINMRILWSGLLFQIFFSKKLGTKKWIALFLLMLGCAVKQVGSDFRLEATPLHLFAIAFQAFTSSFGGVYSEWLVKKNLEVSLNVKNMYLYFFSICFNFLFILFFKTDMLLVPGEFFRGYSNLVVVVILVGAFCGFSTSLFLRYLNVLLKEYAHSAEMVVTVIFSYFLWGTVIDAKVLLSVGLTSASVYLYNQSGH